jgi:hypothetical protein
VYKKDVFHKKVFGSVEELSLSSSAALLLGDECGGATFGRGADQMHSSSEEVSPTSGNSSEAVRRAAIAKQMRNRCFRVESCDR